MKMDFVLVMGIIMSVIVIFCFCFSVWNVFITKKQTTLSLADLCLAMSVEVLLSIKLDFITLGVTNIILITWWIVVIIQVEKNLDRQKQRKEKKNEEKVKPKAK